MKDLEMTTPSAIRVVLTLNSLGSIPEHQPASPIQQKKADAYFDDGLCDEPLHEQIRHFGTITAAEMVRSELASWLSDLGTEPQIHDITFDY